MGGVFVYKLYFSFITSLSILHQYSHSFLISNSSKRFFMSFILFCLFKLLLSVPSTFFLYFIVFIMTGAIAFKTGSPTSYCFSVTVCKVFQNNGNLYMSLCVRKPTIWVSDKVLHKPGCAATEAG